MVIWFDMDGTIANLYNVKNWLSYLQAMEATPYLEAAPMVDMRLLARYLNLIQKRGCELGIISWLSRESTQEYDEAVTKAKRLWLKKHLHSVEWNEIHIVPYGTPKEHFSKGINDILFDDEKRNRDNWNGTAYEPSEIINVLKSMIK